MDYKRLGKRIREERHRLNLTQAQLAEDIDISDTYMGAIERGERSLTLDTLVRLVNRLGVSVDYMLSDSVTDSDTNILEQFRQITDCQPLERKQMAINVLHTIFSYFDKDEA
ncbi:MAG: helix-turn-helix transcriptional regulator [Lachnospiraceae bacterium]|jgi:transcriptional regulator with XRE-family HTH domain|nr:helix-turn-helix transcriptional regulator [Lachnospiraceae bacterium]